MKKQNYNTVPELPEIEVVRQGISAQLTGLAISKVLVRNHYFKIPIPQNLPEIITGKTIVDISRRGKYLLFSLNLGTLIWHMGMSGTLQVSTPSPLTKHDHVELIFSNSMQLRFNDPRRFGLLIFTQDDPFMHPLLKSLGPEPLTSDYDAEYFIKIAKNKQINIKNFLMNSKIIVGIGNIYANEILFAVKINPTTPVNTITFPQWEEICHAIKKILSTAISHGGTTLKDYLHIDGKPGYFKQQLQVYGRSGENCQICNTTLEEIRISQRTTTFCPQCQPVQ